MTTLKDYLTQDMVDDSVYMWDSVPYENWRPAYVPPYRPIHQYPTYQLPSSIIYPYSAPYKDS